jgi:hypothetical protein
MCNIPLKSVSPIEDKTERNEVIEEELQAVLNTLTEHDLQDAFEAEALGMVHMCGRGILLG